MPAVDSREKDGLNYPEFNNLLSRLLSSPQSYWDRNNNT